MATPRTIRASFHRAAVIADSRIGLYRVEIHDGGEIGTATFKWSRDNASVASGVSAIDGADNLTVDRAVWDSVRAFQPGDWVEITDDLREFSLQPGEIRQIDSVNDSTQHHAHICADRRAFSGRCTRHTPIRSVTRESSAGIRSPARNNLEVDRRPGSKG